MQAADAPVSADTIPRLVDVVSDPDMTLASVADVVRSDIGLAARVLSVANSAAFGLSRQVTELQQAVSLVGAQLCQTLAIVGSCNLLDSSSGLPLARDHSLGVACAARLLAASGGLHGPDAFAAGLLHDLGEILLWNEQPDDYATAHAGWETPMEQLRGERGMFGRDHALVAREQLAEWKLPGQVVDAVGDHHRPDMLHTDLSTLVIVAEEAVDPEVEWSPRFALFGVEPSGLASLRDQVADAVAELVETLA